MTVPKAELDRRISQFAETCRRSGTKVTHQRMEVFRELAGSHEHPDVETLYKQVRRRITGISRDTVYRTLATLEAQGLIRRTEVLGGPTRYDANTERHHHFVCTRCGIVKDFCSQALDNLPIPKTVEAFGSIETAQVQVRGVCSSCASAETKSRRRSPA